MHNDDNKNKINLLDTLMDVMFCKSCETETKHMDLGGLPDTNPFLEAFLSGKWKCFRCGECNEKEGKI